MSSKASSCTPSFASSGESTRAAIEQIYCLATLTSNILRSPAWLPPSPFRPLPPAYPSPPSSGFQEPDLLPSSFSLQPHHLANLPCREHLNSLKQEGFCVCDEEKQDCFAFFSRTLYLPISSGSHLPYWCSTEDVKEDFHWKFWLCPRYSGTCKEKKIEKKIVS